MSYEIKLDVFEGPLDLLLYLIRKNEIDIYNIPISLIAEQYLQYLEMMRSLNLDLAGEYLVLASTLVHIKSKMLLPPVEGESEDEDGEDPRAELVRQLLEYQAFKEAALKLDGRPILERDLFKRGVHIEDEVEVDEEDEAGFDRSEDLEIDVEKMSLTDRINEIMERLSEEKQLSFLDLLGDRRDRKRIVYTFLAILELMKLRVVRAFQTDSFGAIRLFLAVKEE